MGNKKISPEDLRIQVVFLRTAKEKLEGEFKEDLIKAVAEAKAKFPKFSPMIEGMVKTCEKENAAGLAIVLAQEIQYGISSEEAMKEHLETAKIIFDEWIKISETAKKQQGES